jgi:hypothetical protein
LVVALYIEVGIAFAVVLRSVVDGLIVIIRIVDFTTYPTAPDIAAPRIEIGIAIPVELRLSSMTLRRLSSGLSTRQPVPRQPS